MREPIVRWPLHRLFAVGDFVEILCQDGAVFHGWLTDITEQYVLLNGPRGFANADIVHLRHG